MTTQPKLSRRILLAGLCACCVGTPTGGFAATPTAPDDAFGTTGLPTALELGRDAMQRIAADVWVSEIAPGVIMHTTTHPVGGLMYPANGLIVSTPDGAVMIDTGWTPDHARVLFDWTTKSLPRPVTLAVATHYHDDRTGGIDALRARGIRTLAHPLTCRLARETGNAVPEPIAGFGDAPHALRDGIELWLPGAGHTRDNVVVWLAGPKILYGGCFLKSSSSASLGNIADAVLADWAGSVTRTRERYIGTTLVVPGHGTITGDAIGTTLQLLAAKAAGK